MRESDIVRTVTIRHKTEGSEQAKADLKGIAAAQDQLAQSSENLGRASETSARRQASSLRSFEQIERKASPAARALQEYERAQQIVGRAVSQNASLQDRGAAILSEYAARVESAKNSTQKFTGQSGLARHELINLGRQAQDVAVSLGSGQGFGTVLLQQGTQILDVLGTSQGGIRGALGSIGTSLRGLVTVGRAAFSGIVAGAAGAAFATANYLSEQKNVERSLIGAGRRSGTPADINAIAGGRSSATGLSVSETREAALEFARIGQIHSRVIGEMIETTKNFALVTGQSSKEAAAALAGAFTNIQGIDQLNKQFDFLDGNTRRLVEQLLLAGRTTDAAALANDRLKSSLKAVEDTQGGLARGWTAIANAVSNAADKVGEYIAKSTGLQRSSKSDRAVELSEEIERLESMGSGGGRIFEATLQKYREELEAIGAELRKEHWGRAFNALSVSASQAVAATNPLQASLDAVVGKLTLLRDAAASGVNVAGLQQAVQYYEQIAQHIQNQMQAADDLAAKYPGMTAEFAKQVNALEDQNRLLKARQNGTEATVSAAIAYENAIEAGANATEAAAIKSLTLKNNLMQAAAAAEGIGAVRNLNIGIGAQNFGEWMSEAEADAAFAADRNNGRSIFAPNEMTQSGSFFLPSASLSAPGALRAAFMGQAVGATFGQGSSVNPQEIFAAMKNAEAQFLSGSSNNTDKIAGLRMQIEALYPTLGAHPENIWQIRTLERAMEELMNAVDENTEALNKVTLNPLYTEGRSALKVGYMGAASGVDFTVRGGIPGVDSVPVHIMAQQGERVQVTPAGEVSNDNSRSVQITNNNYFGESRRTSRRSERQLSQRFGQMMAANS